jgi:hypothetical protein
MAAWTLPHRITDWCENLTTALDRRSRFLVKILHFNQKKRADGKAGSISIASHDKMSLLYETCDRRDRITLTD